MIIEKANLSDSIFSFFFQATFLISLPNGVIHQLLVACLHFYPPYWENLGYVL